ncbi:MAG: lysophospholipid acyltransferase family protein [Balneolaceae bacterium]|nr:lysophospholipid acyltransferase family protein [Balneolaceae bacterium]
MKKIRSTIRITLLILFTLTSYLFFFFPYVVLRLFRMNYQPLRNAYMKFWSWGLTKILNIHIQVEGKAPEPPFFMVSNHLSYIDIIPMFLNLDCTFVAKKEVRHWPVLGFMVSTMGVIFVDRSRKRDVKRVNSILTGSLTKYQGVVIFPEGTTSGGDRVLPFRPPLLEFPATFKVPVYYSALRYETDTDHGDLPAERSVCFYGARDPFHKHVAMLAGNRRIDCKMTFSDDPVMLEDRKELAIELQGKVSGLFEPMEA